jgi:hypothetical protein
VPCERLFSAASYHWPKKKLTNRCAEVFRSHPAFGPSEWKSFVNRIEAAEGFLAKDAGVVETLMTV